MNELEWIRCVAAAILILSGLFVMLSAVFGVFRFRFVLNRMHCAGMADTLGLFLLSLGLMLIAPSWNDVLKLLVILVLFWIGSPLTSHLLARMELTTDVSVPLHVRETNASVEELMPEKEVR